MPDQTLVVALTNAVLQARRDIAAATCADNRTRWSYIAPSTTRTFADSLAKHDDAARVLGSFIQSKSRSIQLSIDAAALHLIDRGFDHDPSDIIASLQTFLADLAIENVHVRALGGLAIKTTIDLGNGIAVGPPGIAPQDEITRSIFTQSPVFHAPNASAGVIIWRETEVFRIATPPPPGGVPVPPVPKRDPPLGLAEHKWMSALHALALASGTAVHLREAYSHTVTLGWPFMAGGGFAGGPSARWQSYDAPLDPELCRRLYGQLARHVKSEKIALACRKLLAARAKSDLTEKLIDLGTCLEVLLMDEGGSSEIKNKVCSRAAWLLGSDFASRKRTFAIASDLYDGRSKAVHTGKATGWKLAAEAGTGVLPHMLHDRLCSDLIVALLARDAWPQWTDLVLGG